MKLTGEVIKVRYVNEENGYSVFDLNTSDGEIKIVGIFDSVKAIVYPYRNVARYLYMLLLIVSDRNNIGIV